MPAAQPQRPDFLSTARKPTPAPVAPPPRTLMEEDGKTITYSVSPASRFLWHDIPYVTLNSGDGEVEFVGVDEIRDARDALNLALAAAERCGS